MIAILSSAYHNIRKISIENFLGGNTKFRRYFGKLYKVTIRDSCKISGKIIIKFPVVIIDYDAQLVYNNPESGKIQAEQELVDP